MTSKKLAAAPPIVFEDFSRRHSVVLSPSVKVDVAPPVTSDWPDQPGSINPMTEPVDFPVDALPAKIREAVLEYSGYGQQPIALIASSALAAAALAAQGLADVSRDEQLTGPLSINLLIIAQSGERKSAADKAFTKSLLDFEQSKRDEQAAEIRQSRAQHSAWQAVYEGIEASIRKQATAGKDITELTSKLEAHAEAEPRELVEMVLRYEDCNPESLANLLGRGHASAALWSDEAGLVVGSQGMGRDSMLRFFSFLNRLWDGGFFRQNRKSAASTSVEGRRFSCCLMLQPAVLKSLLDGSNGLSRGSGFLARYLVCQPTSTIGGRAYTEPGPMPALAAFNQQVRSLLERPMNVDEQGRLEPPIISLSVEAKTVWRQFFDSTERRLGPVGDLDMVRDFASKSAENAARIAAVFHVFEGCSSGSLNSETMRRGAKLAGWYLGEALRVMQSMDEPKAVADARALEAWMEIDEEASTGEVSTRRISQYGPSCLRDKSRRDAAITVLVDAGRAAVVSVGKQRDLHRHPALRSTSLLGDGRAATATPAISATDRLTAPLKVAGVATVAVATPHSDHSRTAQTAKPKIVERFL